MAPVRHQRARPAAGLRPGRLARGPRLPRRDGRRRQLRPGQPPAARPRDPAGLRRAGLGAACDLRLRRLAQPRQARDARGRRRPHGGCACTARAPPGRCRPATPTCRADLRRGRASRCWSPARWAPPRTCWSACPAAPAFHSACHGAGRVLSRHAAARRSRGRQLRPRAGGGAASRCAGASGAGWPRRPRRRTRTSTRWSAASRGRRPGRQVARLVPVGVVKG